MIWSMPCLALSVFFINGLIIRPLSRQRTHNFVDVFFIFDTLLKK